MRSACPVSYLKLHPDCTVISLSHLSSNSLLLKILKITIPSDPLAGLQRPKETQVLSIVPKVLVPHAIFHQSHEGFKVFRVSIKKELKYSLSSRDDKHLCHSQLQLKQFIM